eukprot:COSAG06_NODE_695_length_13008_cov_57.728097_8_plen_107_part_00
MCCLRAPRKHRTRGTWTAAAVRPTILRLLPVRGLIISKVKNAYLLRHFILKMSLLYQDRLGTKQGKAQKRDAWFDYFKAGIIVSTQQKLLSAQVGWWGYMYHSLAR